jgi:hypothetical protein
MIPIDGDVATIVFPAVLGEAKHHAALSVCIQRD